MAAFANTEGGRLLVGVKDNGKIAGVRSDEEFHMIEAAAQMYCKPPVSFEAKAWEIEGKTVLLVRIEKSDFKLHKALDNGGKFKVYVRVKDQNLLANTIYINAQKQQKSNIGKSFLLSKPVVLLLNTLKEEGTITYGKFRSEAKISPGAAHRILSDLLALNVIQIHFTDKLTYYTLVSKSEEE